MKRYIFILCFVLAACVEADSFAEASPQCAVLLHGMGRTSQSMSLIETRLIEENYSVLNESYASTDASIAEITEQAVGGGVQYCTELQAEEIHFVTHSLGGILVRNYLQDRRIPNLGKIVMLAPPNQGSEIVDLLRDYRVYDFAMGQAGQVLGTKADSLPNRLKPIQGEIGIIAGNATSDPWFSPLIPGEDDGKVSVERTKLNEMKDFLVVDSGHSFIMRNDDVIDQIVAFLQTGSFDHDYDHEG